MDLSLLVCLSGHLCLKDVWLGVVSTDTRKKKEKKKTMYVVQCVDRFGVDNQQTKFWVGGEGGLI